MLAKTSDGRIIISSRNGWRSGLDAENGDNPHARAIAYSDTGFSNWSRLTIEPTLVDPTCMGSLIAYDVQGLPYMLISSNCNDTNSRKNLTLRFSFNDGQTWDKSIVVDSDLAGYSDLAVDSKGTIYVLYEVQAGLTVNLARYKVGDIK
jgi:sialidase-1